MAGIFKSTPCNLLFLPACHAFLFYFLLAVETWEASSWAITCTQCGDAEAMAKKQRRLNLEGFCSSQTIICIILVGIKFSFNRNTRIDHEAAIRLVFFLISVTSITLGPNPKQTLINQQLFHSHVDSVIHLLPCWCYFCPLNQCFPACHRSVVASKSDKHYQRCIRQGFQGLCLVSACWLRRLLLLYGLHTLIG